MNDTICGQDASSTHYNETAQQIMNRYPYLS
jgi:hypothetical protein